MLVYSNITVISQMTIARPSCSGILAYEYMNEWCSMRYRGHVYSTQGHSTEHITNSICRLKIGQRRGIICTKKNLRAIPLYFGVLKDRITANLYLTIA